jgi:uncharacterized protein
LGKLGFIAYRSWEKNRNATTTRLRRASAQRAKPQPGGLPMDIHHPFVSEFPEHRETIRSLKLADGKFRAMFEEYHKLDDEICRIEEEVEYATDQELDELKFKRAKLKDALYAAVVKSEAALVH